VLEVAAQGKIPNPKSTVLFALSFIPKMKHLSGILFFSLHFTRFKAGGKINIAV